MSLVPLLNDLKSYYPYAAQLTYSQLLQIEDFGSNIHDLNQYSGHSVYSS